MVHSKALMTCLFCDVPNSSFAATLRVKITEKQHTLLPFALELRKRVQIGRGLLLINISNRVQPPLGFRQSGAWVALPQGETKNYWKGLLVCVIKW